MSLSIEEYSRQCPKWTIEVHAVPRSVRHVIQTRILVEALPSIRRWPLENPHSTTRGGTNRLAFRFDELNGELISEEQASMEWQTEKRDVIRPSNRILPGLEP